MSLPVPLQLVICHSFTAPRPVHIVPILKMTPVGVETLTFCYWYYFLFFIFYCTFLELNRALRFSMDFSCMNFGDLLFALNCDRLKNEIRKIENINKRIVQYKMVFILMIYALKTDFTPIFLIYTYNNRLYLQIF